MNQSTEILVASFDIGKRNFAFCIERMDANGWGSTVLPPMHHRYERNGPCTPAFARVLNRVYQNGSILVLENIDLSKQAPPELPEKEAIVMAMTRVLDSYADMWVQCSAFIVEQQMSFGRKRNPMATRLGNHCLSYFSIHHGLFKPVVEFPAYHKTRVLGAQRKLSKYQRKQWAVRKARKILTDRNDDHAYKLHAQGHKLDDLADVCVQLQAFKYMAFIEKSI